MDSGRAGRSTSGPAPVSHRFAVLRRAVHDLDDRLSRRQNVVVFSDDPACILKCAPTAAVRAVSLSDGTAIARGDPLLDIHCWNDRVPAMPRGGADLAWARRASAGLRASLRLLARAMADDPALGEARAIRARVSFVGRGGSNESVTRIAHRMGFEDVDERQASAAARLGAGLHDALENVLLGALVWTHNPEALRRDKMIRERRPVWSSRERLMALHGGAGHA